MNGYRDRTRSRRPEPAGRSRHELEQGGLGFGIYMAVDLALVADVLPDSASVAKDLGVMNIAGVLPFSIGPALAPMVLAAGRGGYAFLYAVAGACALASAGAILRVRQVR